LVDFEEVVNSEVALYFLSILINLISTMKFFHLCTRSDKWNFFKFWSNFCFHFSSSFSYAKFS